MIKKLLVVLAVIVVLTIFSIPSFANPPENASGFWYYIPAISEERVNGGNITWIGTEVGNWTGTFYGHSEDCFDMDPTIVDCAVSEGSGEVYVHRNGHWFYRATIQISSASVDDKTGGLELQVHGMRPSASADWEGWWVITGGTGELADLHGRGTWWGLGFIPPSVGQALEPGVLEYSGTVHFDPG